MFTILAVYLNWWVAFFMISGNKHKTPFCGYNFHKGGAYYDRVNDGLSSMFLITSNSGLYGNLCSG